MTLRREKEMNWNSWKLKNFFIIFKFDQGVTSTMTYSYFHDFHIA